VTFEVSSCTKFQIVQSSAPYPAGELTALPRKPQLVGRMARYGRSFAPLPVNHTSLMLLMDGWMDGWMVRV